jgi:hypothetical protein
MGDKRLLGLLASGKINGLLVFRENAVALRTNEAVNTPPPPSQK